MATRSAMPYGIMAFALVYLLPGIVVLAAIGSNVYWISLVAQAAAPAADEETVAACNSDCRLQLRSVWSWK